MRNFFLAFFLSNLFFVSLAHGQFYFEETFFPIYVKNNNADAAAGGSTTNKVSTESGLGTDFRTTMGYVFNNMFVFGLTYNAYNISTSRAATTDSEGKYTETSRNELGPTLGFLWRGWRFAFTYFFQADKKAREKYTLNDGSTSTDNTWKNTSGSGFQFAVSYGVSLGSGFEIGPSLVYRSMTYKKQSRIDAAGSGSYGETQLLTEGVDGDLSPMVTVSYKY